MKKEPQTTICVVLCVIYNNTMHLIILNTKILSKYYHCSFPNRGDLQVHMTTGTRIPDPPFSIGPGYTSINSGKNVFIPIMNPWATHLYHMSLERGMTGLSD